MPGPILVTQTILERTDLGALQAKWIDAGGSEHDARAYGAVLDGTTDDEEALSNAIEAAQASGVKLITLRGGTARVGSNLTIPAGVSLRALEGAKLQPASGVTVTINGAFDAGLYQVFDTSAGGSVVFGSGAVERFVPQWWGGKGDGVTDDTAAIQAAIDAAPNQSTVLIPPGTYRIGMVFIDQSLTILGHGATLVGIAGAMFAVRTAIDSLTIEGFVASFENDSGTTGKEFFVNAREGSSFGEELTAYGTFNVVNDVARLTIRQCSLGACKVTVAGEATALWMVDNVWEHEDGTHAAPYYLLVANGTHARISRNRFLVYPPDGDNKDIIKISNATPGAQGSQGVLIDGNYLHNLNPECTCAQIDTYTGGRRTKVVNNDLLNVQVHCKAWGEVSGGEEMDAFGIDGNVFVREDGFELLYEVQAFIYAINTRLGIRNNQFIDRAPSSPSMTCIALRRTADDSTFDALNTSHCKAVVVANNIATFVNGNNANGVFIRWDANDAGDPRGDLVVQGNVMNGGAGWFRAAVGAVRPTFTTWSGNIANDPVTSEELQVGRPFYSDGNVWRSVVDRGLREYRLTLAAGDNNDVDLLDTETAYLTADASGSTLTGIAFVGAYARNRIRIVNVGPGILTLGHQHTGSVASSRILSPTGANVDLDADEVADLEYDITSNIWRIVGLLQ